MEVSYKQAMETLQSMFEKFDKETIQAVLASNEGHLERTIEDLMKLNEEIENSPDDDNLFADTDSRPSYPNSYGGGYQSNAGARNVQESEDAKLAYQLQMQEIRQEEQEKQAALAQHHGQPANRYSHSQPVNQYGGNQPIGNELPNQYGHQQGGMAYSDKKKETFYKKVKVGLNNLFKRKGKAGNKGPTRNPGIYAEIDGGDGNAQLNPMEDDDNEAPMQLHDVLGGGPLNNDDSPRSPASPYNNRRHDEREYHRNRPSQFNEMNYTGEL